MSEEQIRPRHRPTLQGERVKLRAPIESDRRDRLFYGRNPEFRRMVGGDPGPCPPLSAQEVEGWYRRLCAEPLHRVMETEGRCIGAARLHVLDEAGRHARHEELSPR